EVALPHTMIQSRDILYIQGTYAQIERFAHACDLLILDAQTVERTTDAQTYATGEVGIAEVLLTPTSVLIHRMVADSGFREKYRVNIIGIKRRDQYLLQRLKDVKMQFGDALLVQGTWKD